MTRLVSCFEPAVARRAPGREARLRAEIYFEHNRSAKVSVFLKERQMCANPVGPPYKTPQALALGLFHLVSTAATASKRHPNSFSHYRHFASILCNTVHIHIGRPNHKVYMYIADITASGYEFLG